MATRIEELASNGTLYYRGDECLEIAPFDNYYMFTVYKESPDVNKVDESVPLDLTHIGFIYLLFPDGENEIRIQNYTEAKNVDMVNGQVVFRIDKATAKRILATSGRTFYITAQMTDGKTAGDETVLYTGKFVDFATGMSNSLTSTVATLKATINDLKVKIEEDALTYSGQLDIANEKIKSLEATIEANEKTIRELQDTIDAYDSDVVDYIKANILKTEYTRKDTSELPLVEMETQSSAMTTSSMEMMAEGFEVTK
jgi:hypothetical protein